MPPDSTGTANAQKLTKKQRKSLAFRQKKSKGRSLRPEPDDVPESESDNLDLDEQPDETIQEASSGSTLNANGNTHAKKTEETQPASKKRKHADSENNVDGAAQDDSSKAKKKKKRKVSEEGEANENVNGGAEQPTISKKADAKSRYILFVGNLKYTTTKDAIQAHFSHCDPPPTIRLLTPKPSSKSTTSKSKGCAFLEFTSHIALQLALKQHHSTLDGRQINVELTAGGGGKSASRLEKVRGRNRELDKQRTKRAQKQSTETPQPDGAAPDRPQRRSSTSGTTSAPTQRRTWSIPDAGDDSTHRGGVKHVKKRGVKKGRKEKDWRTGVNAIPVG